MPSLRACTIRGSFCFPGLPLVIKEKTSSPRSASLVENPTAILSREDRCTETGVWYSCETLELVIELAEACPAFFRPRVSQCVAGMVQVRAIGLASV